MATKAKPEAPPEHDENEKGEGAQPEAPKKKGLIGRILAPVLGITRLLRFVNPLAILKLPRKLQLIVAAGLLVVLGGGGAGLYFFVLAAPKTDQTAEAESVKTETDKL